ncbi:MAG: hypothetical protein A2992_07595 [Elusimicrobia bacterium RIFCSPLOWO2_01_FULL_59_12]|nr:MAG: hypothetical protein A2992_07595 [Elusimicrobia bacterium RIFCSPLOWO2_01_FULL_59_12]
MAAESVQALPYGTPAGSPLFQISLPASLGYVSDTYSANPKLETRNPKPDIILIQDLHVNRSVQFAISGILKRLKEQGLMPGQIAVEGDTGPIEIKSMQRYPDPSIRKEAADYLVRQGEMPGAMHFAVSEGEGGLFGIETDEYYQANLEMFRRSYNGRSVLRKEIEKIQAVLPKLKKDAASRENAAILDKDVQAVSRLINNQVIPDELPATLAAASAAVDHLKLVLPSPSSPRQVVSRGPEAFEKKTLDSPLTTAGNDVQSLIEPLSASINFYALALLRDEELFKNALAVRELGHQKTTVVVTGGFHTQALAERCKQKGLSYAVITPNVKRHDKVDETLYVERLLGHHLTPEQAATGQDWAAMRMIQVGQIAGRLWYGVTGHFAARRGRRPKLKEAVAMTMAGFALLGQVVKSEGGSAPQGALSRSQSVPASQNPESAGQIPSAPLTIRRAVLATLLGLGTPAFALGSTGDLTLIHYSLAGSAVLAVGVSTFLLIYRWMGPSTKVAGRRQIRELRRFLTDHGDRNQIGVVLYKGGLDPHRTGAIRILRIGDSRAPGHHDRLALHRLGDFPWIDAVHPWPLVLTAENAGAGMAAKNWIVVARTRALEQTLTAWIEERMASATGRNDPQAPSAPAQKSETPGQGFRTSALKSVVLAVGLATGFAILSHILQSAAIYAADLHAIVVQHQEQRALLHYLQNALSAADLKMKTFAAGLFVIPVGMMVNKELGHRWKERLARLRSIAATARAA